MPSLYLPSVLPATPTLHSLRVYEHLEPLRVLHIMLKLLMCVYICSCILLNSSLTPVTSFHLAAYRSYTSLIMQVKNTESSSKVHKNKYNKFSNKVNDPLLEAIQREQESIRSKTFTFRGTTSQIIPQRKSKQRSASKNSSSSRFVFENVSSVVPSDPFTFGYIQIGACFPSPSSTFLRLI